MSWPGKPERLQAFFRRLKAAPLASSAAEAFELLADVLNSVEDEMTPIPYDPANWASDGRVYPPQPDSARRVKDRPDVTRYRSVGHNTFVAANGALLIMDLKGNVLLEKPGSDGRSIGEV